MVLISHHRLGRGTRPGRTRAALSLSLLAVLFLRLRRHHLDLFLVSPGPPSQRDLLAAPLPFDAEENSATVKGWRASLASGCREAAGAADLEALAARMTGGFAGGTPPPPSPLPPPPPTSASGGGAVLPCRYVVIDLGANVGDTLGHSVDAGLGGLGCDRSADLAGSAAVPPPAFDLTTGTVVAGGRRRNKVAEWLGHIIEENLGPGYGPEDYCYYGVEGNPVFTGRLQALERRVMDLRPRPLRHAHFLTGSVGAGEDGPAKLWLDTVNAKENYWGSSVFKGHQDVRKSAAETNSTETYADVEGYTVGRLMRMTLEDLQEGSQREGGGHLLLKVDIEGGEYPLMVQAAEEGALCDYVARGNQADLFVEFHSQRVTGPNPLMSKKKDAVEKLEACGVKFRNLQAWWA